MTPLEVLNKYYGYDAFRPMQADIIDSILSGRDTLALLPTGGGKSICFQVPTLVMADNRGKDEGTLCLVVTPLIALMKDQVENLRHRGICAAAIYTGMTRDEQRVALDNCRYGPYHFLYVSPERLESEEFRNQLTTLNICMIAIDEAHCISQWGYDFRPSYIRIADIRKSLPEVPVLALTATATPEVVEDIQRSLGLKEKNVIKTSFARENIQYIVRHTEDKMMEIEHILSRVPGAAIVYVRNRKRAEQVAEELQKAGVQSDFYHAGLTSYERNRKQEVWKKDKCRVIVCTNAFGMGIDKPEVRVVIHHDLPDSIEAYFQEAGRAGRDGKTAYAVLLFHDRDKGIVRKRITDNYPDPEQVEAVYHRLCDYLQIGLGSGLDHTFAFDFEQFCTDMKLGFLTTYSALNLLKQAGYIIFRDEEEISTRVRILTSREQLYGMRQSGFQERLLSALMRHYSGIFTDPQYINEQHLIEELNTNEHSLHVSLVAMAKAHTIAYIPGGKSSMVYFPLERQENIYLKPQIYLDRRKHYDERLTAMIEYAENTQFCRSQILLSYFGETTASACGTCDVCRSKAH